MCQFVSLDKNGIEHRKKFTGHFVSAGSFSVLDRSVRRIDVINRFSPYAATYVSDPSVYDTHR